MKTKRGLYLFLGGIVNHQKIIGHEIRMEEILVNLHMHTHYSDGGGRHEDIANAAIEAGVDVVIVTDHNILVQDMEGYCQRDDKRVLVLVGEEIHDPTRLPQKSHLLVFGASKELAHYAAKPQNLIDQVVKAGGLAFLAHPHDDPLKAFGEDDISWADWDVRGYHGIELWNGFSELKRIIGHRGRLRGKLEGLYYAYFPEVMARGPDPRTLKKWDELTGKGQKVAAIGGSDAHAIPMRMGPLRRTIFPYLFHFRAINTHLMLDAPLSGELERDRRVVLDALKIGRGFIGYDLPYPTRGFRFSAQWTEGVANMGEEIRVSRGATFQVRMPIKAECRLLRDGEPIRVWKNQEICAHIDSRPGVYRVECYLEYLGRQRGWVFSNPIYARP
jgi:hypothetical protein